MEIITIFLTGPVLPATILLGLLIVWSCLALLGTVDLHMHGGHVDMPGDLHLDVHHPGGPGGVTATEGLGLLALKWMNLKDVPIVLWMGTFAVIWWFVSAVLWTLVDVRFFSPPSLLWSSLLILKNLAIALPITKVLTSPMKHWFVRENLDAISIIGQECQISSHDATPAFGQAKFKTDGSPLLLNVRTDGPHLAQGTRVWITHYDAKRRLYIVSPTGAHGTLFDSNTREE